MDSDKEKALDKAYEKVIAISFNQASVDLAETFVVPDVMGFGTTADEQIHNLKEYISVVKSQMEQSKAEGLTFNFETQTLHRRISPGQDSALFVDLIKATLSSNDEAVHQFTFRLSVVLEYIGGQWKLVHLHGSMPVDTENDPWHIDEYKRKNEKLEKLVAEQTTDLQEKNRKLEIEAATQRVRTAAMGMQQPDDIMQVLQVIKGEVEKFELKNVGTWVWIFNGNNTLKQWDISELDLNGTLANVNITMDLNTSQSAKRHAPQWKSDDYYVMPWEGDKLQVLIDEVKALDAKSGELFQEAVDEGRMTTYWQACAPFSRGVLVLDYAFEPPEEAEAILRKMSSAFDMAYRRYEDLQEAEQRRKEAELEAAVERVRTRAMGMQTSEDFSDVLSCINRELEKLQLEGQNSAYIWILESEDNFNVWNLEHIEQGSSSKIHSESIDCKEFKFFKRQTENWKKNPEYFVTYAAKDQLYEFMADFRKQTEEIYTAFANKYEEELDQENITEIWAASAGFGQGFVGGDFLQKPGSWIEKVLRKMADAFGMAYQRFEDLQKAEAQAREAQIEAALERVRSRSMGMQNSDELKEVGSVLFQQLEHIGLSPISSWISFVYPYQKYMDIWVAQENNLRDPKRVFADDHPNFDQEIRAWTDEKPHIEITAPKGSFISAVKEIWDMDIEDQPDCAHFHVLNVRHKYGFLGIGTWNMVSPDNIAIYSRFAGVFEQTYTRFLDLQKAEHQAYESKVEASLERVRGMASAMNHSDDLMQIAEAMFMELEILKISPLRYGLAMIDREKAEAELWASTVNDGHYLDMLGTLSLTWHPMLQQAFDAWDSQHEEVIYELKGEELSNYYKKIGLINPEIPNLSDLQDPETDIVQYVCFFPFKTGALYAFTKEKPGEEGRSILKRFAAVYEQAHIRYNDLQIAEEQERRIREERDRLEITLSELQATKDQLVQQEKLASLGQLTAGIAHEIKNPLNFVNNFSEVSIELVDEALEEVRRGTEDRGPGIEKEENPLTPAPSASGRGESEPSADGEARGVSDEAKGGDQPQHSETDSSSDNTPLNPSANWRREAGSSPQMDLIQEILDDIKANLQKIHEHGSRADGIVKSMLQHSRGSDGKPEPTNLNYLVKEYVNLSFQGIRTGNDPINVDIDLQLDDSIGEVPLVAEDFSRVILNICNNGFDAMREKEKLTGDGGPKTGERYEPKLTIRTIKKDSIVTIEIEDNGTGIPDEMKDKIMQPFFTTKKGTQGTGLGLSITNDIIKAHGGTLTMETKKDEFTRFSIQLNHK